MTSRTFYIKKIHKNAILPVRCSDGASGFDLSSVESMNIGPQETKIVKTGLCLEMENGFEAQVRSRSGLAAKHSIVVLNSPGTIDADYRGEIMVILSNQGRNAFHVEKGMRIAQMVFQQVPSIKLEVRESLSDTERGEGGMGSTGLK